MLKSVIGIITEFFTHFFQNPLIKCRSCRIEFRKLINVQDFRMKYSTSLWSGVQSSTRLTCCFCLQTYNGLNSSPSSTSPVLTLPVMNHAGGCEVCQCLDRINSETRTDPELTTSVGKSRNGTVCSPGWSVSREVQVCYTSYTIGHRRGRWRSPGLISTTAEMPQLDPWAKPLSFDCKSILSLDKCMSLDYRRLHMRACKLCTESPGFL